MTRDEIMRIASESGIEWQRHTGVLGRISVTTCGSQSVERLERFAALVAAQEREACAQLCDIRETMFKGYKAEGLPALCAATIRARSQA